MEKSGGSHFNKVIKVSVTNCVKAWHYEPPDVIQNEKHNIIYEVFLPKTSNLSVIKPIEITSSLQATKQIEEQIKQNLREQSDKFRTGHSTSQLAPGLIKVNDNKRGYYSKLKEIREITKYLNKKI